MKNSIKLLTTAGLLLLGSLTAYNMGLRTEYVHGTYRNPFRNYTALALNNFDEVAVPAASAIRVKIVAGPGQVWLNKDAAKYVHVAQQGRRLTLTLAFPKEPEFLGMGEAVIIHCPQLRMLTTDGVYTVAGKTKTDQASLRNAVVVQGFRQDSLAVRQDRGTQIRLVGNTLAWLRASAGARPGSKPALSIGADNRIQAADLTIDHQGHLDLATAIPRVRYQFSDSATIVLTGAAVRSLGTAK